MVNNRDNLFDKRIIEKNIAEGIVSKTDYEEYVANLPDISNKTEYISLSQFHSNS